jgi:hypothetical protein
VCKEVVERTPGGSPVERAAAVGNLTREFRIIENSMEDASQGDVDGDGGVDAKEEKIAASASFAASRAARRTMTRASVEGETDGGVTTELDAQPAAYLAQQQRPNDLRPSTRVKLRFDHRADRRANPRVDL